MECTAHRIWGAARVFTGVSKTAAFRASLVAASLILAAEPARAISASTQPAGFVRASVTGGSPSHQATSLIGTPLLLPAVYAGRVQQARAAAGASEISARAASGTLLPRLDASQPHAVFVTSGDFSGFVFPVIEGSARSVTIENHGFDLAHILAEGDAFEIRPLHTFRTLFGGDAATVPFRAATDAGHADQLLVLREGAWRAYWFSGSTWRRSGSPDDAGDDAILPHDAIVVYRRASSPTEVRFVGEAPSRDAILAIPAGSVSAVANPFPVEVGVGELGLESMSGWRSHVRAEFADQVQVCDGGTWRTFWHDGTRWMSAAGPAADASVDAGAGILVARASGEDPNPYALIPRPYAW